jgi:hypothetical protein
MKMSEENALKICDEFLAAKSLETGTEVARLSIRKIERGWVFHYNSRAYIENGDFGESLVGQGPNIILESGQVLEGGSIDSVESILKRHKLL